MNNDTTLQIISNETKNSINQMPVVTPSVYASIFSKFATDHNTVLDDEAELSRSLLVTECSNLTDLQTQTSTSAQKLSHSTSRAIDAIKKKDDSILTEVLNETETLRSEIEKLKKAIYKDELTQTFNRKWLHDNLLEEDTEKFKKSGIIAMIDLNYFKIINDSFGHVIGDKVLIYIANELKKTKNEVIRYGGDEFIVIFPQEESLQLAILNLNKIRDAIVVKKLQAHDKSFKVSFSFGACKFKNGDSISSIIELADKNMYEDKIKIKKRIPGI